ncbi:hypothetical protein [Allorhizocola rhizosphaerae]|uniref:hypothetical protein n=1 Tax=Allorhizocola rhizosphaerae TaxID=1872709 RepID=UPI0013C2DEFC|nr:hypothetical protein [Allorhizocola rhizosphaerae]
MNRQACPAERSGEGPSSGPDAIERYLEQVGRQLPGGPRVRRDILDELRDGLTQTLEHHGDDTAETALRREFGDPQQIGVALAGEARLRLARRHAVIVLLLLLAGGLGWQAYQSVVGIADSTVPTGWARSVFLAAVEALQACAMLAQIGAVLTVLTVSLPGRWAAEWAARITLVALAGFALAVASMLVSIAPAHRLDAVLVSIPVAGLTLPAIRYAYFATRHLRLR